MRCLIKHRHVTFIAFVGEIAYDPPDGEWFLVPMSVSNLRGIAKSLPTAEYFQQVSLEQELIIVLGKHRGGQRITEPDMAKKIKRFNIV